MHDVDGKLFSGIKSMYVDSLPYIRVNGLHINSGVRQRCIMSCWLFNVFLDIESMWVLFIWRRCMIGLVG